MENDPVQCPLCAAAKHFSLPKHIVDQCIRGDVVIFSGAGISTESRVVYLWKLYDDLKGLLKIPPAQNISFAELCSCFVRRRGRLELLQKIKRRFDNVDSYPELRRTATRFHRELSTIPFIRELITTNWDTYFEEECAAIPVISGFKYLVTNPYQRYVHKIHGSFYDLGSIIATLKDYRLQYKLIRQHQIWSRLRDLLLNKTVVFIRYSFFDEEFLSFFQELRENNSSKQKIYAVTLDNNLFSRTHGLGINIINTSGEHFLHILKEELLRRKILLHDSLYQYGYFQMQETLGEHKKLNSQYPIVKFPETIYCAYFQDGLIHAFERVLSLKNSGYYSLPENIKNSLHIYKGILDRKIKNKNYSDISYINGYGWALHSLLFPKRRIPLYYLYGLNRPLYSLADYSKNRKMAKVISPEAYALAQKMASRLHNDKVEWHHPAYFISYD